MFKLKSKRNQTVDPVCGMAVNRDITTIKSISGGKTYYFCADACQRSFDADPEKYLRNASRKPKGFWGRYLDKVNKATGGKPPSCCQ